MFKFLSLHYFVFKNQDFLFNVHKKFTFEYNKYCYLHLYNYFGYPCDFSQLSNEIFTNKSQVVNIGKINLVAITQYKS